MSSKVTTEPMAPETPSDVAPVCPEASAFTRSLASITVVLFLAALFSPAVLLQ